MFTNQIVSHKNIDTAVMERVIILKQCAWPYPKDSQMKWIRANLKDNDLHVILKEDDKDVAYLNLCDVHCEINNIYVKCWGIGNVCSSIKGKGYGKKLMEYTNEWLMKNNQIGLLFCHESVAEFYAKCGWLLTNADICDIEGITSEILTYVYNLPCPVFSLNYRDRLF